MKKVPVWMMAGAVCGFAALAQAETAVEADLRAKVDMLEKRLSQVEGKSNESWLNERRAEEVKALIQEVLSDADTRASLMQDGVVAGWNKKFFLASPDGTFLLNIGGRIQGRHIFNHRDTPFIDLNDDGDVADSGESNNDSTEAGFTIRRMKPAFSGYIGGPKFEYIVVLAADRNTTVTGLEEAKVGYSFTDQLKVEFGRFKAPFLREELTSSGRQQAVERSYVNEAFTTGFTEGISLTYSTDLFKLAVMFNDGRNQGEISNAANDFQNDTTDYAFTARIDVRIAGDWKQSEDFVAWSGEAVGIFFGAAVHYEGAEQGPSTGVGTNDRNLYWTVDASIEVAGFNIYAAYVGRHFDDEGTVAGQKDFNQTGLLVQAAYMVIPDKLEPFVRFEWIDTDGFSPFANGATAINANYDEQIFLVTVGVNYYFRKHDAKFTLDVVFAPSDAIPVAQTGLGILQDDDDSDGQFIIRTQFQLQF
jgi:hypothetical protein